MAQFDTDMLNDDQFLQALADGELSLDDAGVSRRAEALDPSGAVRASRMKLRWAVGRAMSDVAAPAGLRAGVMGAMSAEPAVGGVSARGVPGRGETRSVLWRIVPRIAAAAAVVVIATVLIVRGAGFGSGLPGGLDRRVVAFVTQTHRECASDEATMDERLSWKSMEQAARFSAIIPADMRGPMEAQFEGLSSRGCERLRTGPCVGLADSPCLHAMMRAPADGYRGAMVSLFIESDPEGAATDIRSRSCLVIADCESRGDELAVWRTGPLIFYVYSESAEATRSVREALQAPAAAH